MSNGASHASTDSVLSVREIRKTFGGGMRLLRTAEQTVAVDGVSFEIPTRQAYGLVGESGSGKTTIGRMVMRLVEPDSGSILYAGRPVFGLTGAELKAYRRKVQMVFQNPYAAFNPRRRVRDILTDAFAIHHLAHSGSLVDEAARLLARVGLSAEMLDRYPHQFSSGQRQRLGIARALSVRPEFLVADEPVSALDVSVQAQVLNLLRSLQQELGLTMLFISHDLRAVTFLCQQVAVLYAGRLMEVGPTRAVVGDPLHPYTAALLRSAPRVGTRRSATVMAGEPGTHSPAGRGCPFAPRCDLRLAMDSPLECTNSRPPLRQISPGRFAACHFVGAGGDGSSPVPESAITNGGGQAA